MNQKTKKILFFIGLGVDIAVTIFLFVIAIIMLATKPNNEIDRMHAVENNGPFIGYFQQHPAVYFWAGVFPLILLLALNIIFLVLYVKKLSKKPEVAVDDLNEEQKAALRAELLKQLEAESKESTPEQKAEEKPEEPKQ